MIQDSLLQFDPAGTAITTTAVSTNSLDLGVNRDSGVGRQGLRLLVTVGNQFTSATPTATLNVQLQGAPDNGAGAPGGWSTLAESGVTGLGQLGAGFKICQISVPRVVQALGLSASTTPGLVATTGTFSSGSPNVTVASAAGIFDGQQVQGIGIVPGTTVATGAGSTSLVLSQNTVAAGAATTVYFSAGIPMPRFLRLNYVCSATMTGGTLSFSGLMLDADAAPLYRAFTTPN